MIVIVDSIYLHILLTDNANPSEDKTTNRCCYVCQTFVAKKLRRSWDAEVVFAKDLNVLKKVKKTGYVAVLI